MDEEVEASSEKAELHVHALQALCVDRESHCWRALSAQQPRQAGHLHFESLGQPLWACLRGMKGLDGLTSMASLWTAGLKLLLQLLTQRCL